MWPFSRQKAETRSAAGETRADSIENPTVPVSSESFLAFFGVNGADLPRVTVDTALTVPAVVAAVAFLSRTMAALPLHVYRDGKGGAEKVGGKLATVVHDAPNDTQDSFKFRQWFWQQVFTGGRGLAWIERNGSVIEAIWPLDPTKTTVQRRNGRVFYTLADKTYDAADVIDVPFMLRPDGLKHYGPVTLAAKAIQLALAMNNYGSNFFAGGGVPPLALTGPLPQGTDAMKRATAEIYRAVDAARKEEKPIVAIPAGHELKPVGYEPDKAQMVEARRYQVEEIARAWQLPPVFLQDLSRATFSNAEQQDLHLVKHLIGQWARALEGEMNLKLFGRGNKGRYVKHALDGLMRGDFKSRMDGYAIAVQNSIRTPDEVRALEDLPAKGGEADKLHIQGATVPLGMQNMGRDDDPPLDENGAEEAA